MDGQDMGAAIKEVERLTKQANATTILETKGERKGFYYLVTDGKATATVAQPGWHSEKLQTPDELRKFIHAEKQDNSAVFIADNEVIFVRDLEDRRDTAFVELIETEPYTWLKVASGKMLSQSDLVRLLRITFKGCLGGESALLPIVRNMRFTSAADANVELKHGRESVGNSIQRQITGEGTIPEEMTLRVPIFENHNFSSPIHCAIEVFPLEQAFKLTPYPLQVRIAKDAALSSIEDLLTHDDLPPVYMGKP